MGTVDLTPRERVLRAFRFERTDRAPFDLSEGFSWPNMDAWFEKEMGLKSVWEIHDHFQTDLRWSIAWLNIPEEHRTPAVLSNFMTKPTYSSAVIDCPLSDVETVEELFERHVWPDPAWWPTDGVANLRRRYPDHAIAVAPGWFPPFCTACNVFGMEEALLKMLTARDVFQAFIDRHTDFLVDLAERLCTAMEGGAGDIFWLGDDVADQRSLLMAPELWRETLKDSLRRQVEVAHRHGLLTLFHSCGAIREIIPDLIEIGVDGVFPFQVSAGGRDAESIARDFGGKILFYGGIDIQGVLSFGTEDETRAEVRKNVDLFADCGGYIVASTHHAIDTVKPQNIAAMLAEAREYRIQ